MTKAGEEQVVLFVTGTSGSGKSSFAQAGLVPSLEKRYESRYTVGRAIFRPSGRPLAALARALVMAGLPEPADADGSLAAIATPAEFNSFVQSHTPTDQVNLIVLDQLEELYTHADDPDRTAEERALMAEQRRQICDILLGVTSWPSVRTHLIVTVRADYLPAFYDHEGMFELVNRQSVYLHAMLADDLERAIQKPIQQQNEELGGGKRWEQVLVRKLAKDAAQDAAYLPLLQATLDSIWRREQRLTLDRYTTLTDAFQVHANMTYLRRGPNGPERSETERETIMAMLLALVRVSLDDDPGHDTRRSVEKSRLIGGDADRKRLVNELSSARLLSVQSVPARQGAPPGTRDVELIDIIHETLLTNWEPLRAAISARREKLRQRTHLELALNDLSWPSKSGRTTSGRASTCWRECGWRRPRRWTDAGTKSSRTPMRRIC